MNSSRAVVVINNSWRVPHSRVLHQLGPHRTTVVVVVELRKVIFTRSATTLNGHFASWLYDLSLKVVVGLNLLLKGSALHLLELPVLKEAGAA